MVRKAGGDNICGRQTVSRDGRGSRRLAGGVDGDSEVRDGQSLGTAVVFDGQHQTERAPVDGVQTACCRHCSGALIHREQTFLVTVSQLVRQLAVCACNRQPASTLPVD